MFCPACNDISFKLYTLLEDPSISWRNLYPFPAFPHSRFSSTLSRASHGTCELCKLLLTCAQDQVGVPQVEDFEACDESISYQIDRYTADDDEEDYMCITGLTFYFGWNDDPRAMRNFSASFFVELVSDSSTLPSVTFSACNFVEPCRLGKTRLCQC